MYANGYDEGSKVSRLASWKQVEKTTGKTPAAILDCPEIPRELINLWGIFNDVIVGVDRLTYADLDSYMRVMHVNLSVWQIRLLMKLEAVRNG